MNDAALPIVTYKGGLYDVVPVPQQTTWGRLVAALSTRRIRPGEKKQVPGWSPVEVRPEMTRCLDAIVAVWALVLDYDGTVALEQAREAWAPWGHVGHSTWQGPPRCRVVVRLSAPCPAELWPGVYDWAKRRDDRIDQTTSDASRFWYQPATAALSVPFEAWVHEGPPLQLDYPGLVAPRPQRKPLQWKTGAGARRLAVRRLDHPDARRAAADYLRADINPNGTAKGAICPGCGRPSLWWAVEQPGPAVCNHRDTCGWVGPLSRVLDCADTGAAV